MMRWPRRRWGYVITCTFPGRNPFSDIAPRRFWTKAGASAEATRQWLACMAVNPQVEWSIKVQPVAPIPNIYADKYWRGDTYIGPEV